MANEEKIDSYYMRLAKDLTNVLFDKGFLAPDLSRESIDGLESYIGYLLQSTVDMGIRAHDLSKKLKQK